MIAEPYNDATCLTAITRVIASLVEQREPALVELAERFPTTVALAAWIHTLPQRDDNGEAGDGPTVRACTPHQRLRIPADDPNCVERAALYVAVGELIDPVPVRRLRTESTPIGLHTFPMEDDEPVTLDPRVTRNALGGVVCVADVPDDDADPSPLAIPLARAIDWIAELAAERAAEVDDGAAMVARARVAMLAAAQRVPLPARAIREVAVTLALAERAARAYGGEGVAIVRRTTEVLTARTVGATARTLRNLSLRIGGYTIRPDWDKIAKVGRVAGHVGERAGWLALRSYLGTLGVHPVMLAEIERELGAEGMTLGKLATEHDPAPNTVGAAAAAAARR